MTFTNEKAIFLQMADRLCDEILAGTYRADDRIPSVREYAVMLGVNTNTAVKTYELLAREGVIYNKRGMGYYVSPDARQQILARRRAAGAVPPDASARHRHCRNRPCVGRKIAPSATFPAIISSKKQKFFRKLCSFPEVFASKE